MKNLYVTIVIGKKGRVLHAEPKPDVPYFALASGRLEEYLINGELGVFPVFQDGTPEFCLKQAGCRTVAKIDLLPDLATEVTDADYQEEMQNCGRITTLDGDSRKILVAGAFEIANREAGSKERLLRARQQVKDTLEKLDPSKDYIIYRTYRKDGAFWDNITVHEDATRIYCNCYIHIL